MSEDAVEPWEDVQTLAEIGQLLYPGGDDEAAKRSGCLYAISVIHSWHRRTSTLPHAILSTALLVEASIYQRAHQHEPEQQSAIRNMYALAFARFINGFTDNLPGTLAMDKVAESLKMPPQWADVRHAITHQRMPELRTLEGVIGPALEWLWWGFWVRLCTGEERVGRDDGDGKEIGEQLISLFKEYLKRCEDWCEVEDFPSSIPSEEVEEFQRRVVEICGTDVKRWDTVASFLVDDGLMFPRRASALSAWPEFMAWEPLLDIRPNTESGTENVNPEWEQAKLIAGTRLMLTLHRKVCEGLPQTPDARARGQKQRTAAAEWLCRMFERGSLWHPLIKWHFLKKKNETVFIESLLLESTEQSLKVAVAFIMRGDQSFQEGWTSLWEAAAGVPFHNGRQVISGAERIEGVERMDIELPERMEESQAWEFLEKGEDEAIAELEASQGGWRRDSSYWSSRWAESEMWPGEEIDKVV